MRRATRLVARLSVAALATLGLAVPVNVVTAAPAAAVGPQTWADEFNAAAGTPVDGNKWKFDIGGGGFGNNELQYYTNSTSNAAHDGQGHLVITARKENPAGYGCWYGSCQYTSARLLTQGKFTQTYGRFEARLKIPRGQGLWPAFWMLGNDIATNPWPNNGEIDIMENIGAEPGTVHGSLHGPGYSGGNPLTGQYTLPGGAALANDFHTYAVDWQPGSLVFSVDGTPVRRIGQSPNYPVQLMLAVFDFPGRASGSDDVPVPEMIVSHVVGT